MYSKRSTFPSVTQVLSPWTDFSAVPPDVLEAASERGTRVHAACAAYIKGLFVMPLPPECAGYFLSFQGWANRNVEDVLLSEEELVDDVHGYCGHPDLVIRMRGDDVFTCIDLKSPASKSKTWRLQLAAYRCLCERKGLEIFRVASLRLRKDGRPPIFDEYTGTVAADFGVFLACLTAYRFFNPNGGQHD